MSPLFIHRESLAAGHPADRLMRDFPHYAFLYKAEAKAEPPTANAEPPTAEAEPPTAEAEYTLVWTHIADDGLDERHLVDVLNGFIFKYIDGDTPFSMYIDAATQEVRVVLMRDTPIPVLVYHRYDERVGTLVRKGDMLALPYTMELLPLSQMPSTVFVPEDVVVAHVRATLFPKPRHMPGEKNGHFAGPLGPPVEIDDAIVLPAGTYATVAELATALNASFKPHARRQAHLAFQPTRKKISVLRLAPRTRKTERFGYSHACTFEATPTEAGFLLGLVAPVKVALDDKKQFIDFHGLPSGLIM